MVVKNSILLWKVVDKRRGDFILLEYKCYEGRDFYCLFVILFLVFGIVVFDV